MMFGSIGQERTAYSKISKMSIVLWKLDVVKWKISSLEFIQICGSNSPRNSFFSISQYRQEAIDKKGAF
jgi:hypothetical protein